LQTDLSKLAKASNVGFSLNIDQLPIRREMFEIDSDDAISMALFGGDDYELCFTIPKEKRDEFEQKWHENFKTRLSHVGMIIKKFNEYKHNGQDYAVENENFRHF
jgi:thiamine-monophosphate kinase